MLLPPADVLANWPSPNYENPQTQGLPLIIINIFFIVLMTIAVPLRLYTRYRNKGRTGYDDLFITIAYFFSVALGIVVILANVKYEWNRHLWDVEFSMYSRASQMAMISKLLFTLAATFTRASLICFYFRMIKDTGHKLFYWILVGAQLYNIAICITFGFIIIFLCVPIRAYWVFPLIKRAKCLNEGTATIIPGVLNCVLDLMVTVLPIPIVMGLNMPFKQRVGVCVLLCLGLVVTIAGVVRTYYIWRTLMENYDETWDSMPLYICATVEIDLSVLCACAPALKPLFMPIVTGVTEMLNSSRGSKGMTSRNTTRNDTAISRSVTVSQSHQRIGKDEDKYPITLVTIDGAGSDEDDSGSDRGSREGTRGPTGSIPNPHPSRGTPSHSSQRPVLVRPTGAQHFGPSEWPLEEDDFDENNTELSNHSQRYPGEPELEKGSRNTRVRISEGVHGDWV